jgi:glutamyl-tRNA reductase
VGLVLVGLNHRTAPVELREKVAFDAAGTLRGLERLSRGSNSAEAVILSTCNRVEVTAFHDHDAGLVEEVERFLCEFHGVSRGELSRHLYRLRGHDAIVHLFRVASSLDSMVPGESQVLAQVKDAYLASADAGYTGKHLNVLFQRAFRVGKLVHTNTDIARRKVSVSSVAVELAEKSLGDLSRKTVLVLGAGETGRLTLKNLIESGVGRLLVANRTASRARSIAKGFGGEAVGWKDVRAHLAQADIVIASTSSRAFVLERADVAAAKGRESRPLVVIDIAVPRNVHPAVGRIPGVRLYDIDDLEKVVARNIGRREREFRRCEKLIDSEVREFETWLGGHEVEELLVGLVRQTIDASHAELEKLWRKVPEIEAKRRKQIEGSIERLVKSLLHKPKDVLRKTGRSDGVGR